MATHVRKVIIGIGFLPRFKTTIHDTNVSGFVAYLYHWSCLGMLGKESRAIEHCSSAKG